MWSGIMLIHLHSAYTNVCVCVGFSMFAKLQKALSCLSICTELRSHWTDFHLHLVPEYSSETCQENSSFIQI